MPADASDSDTLSDNVAYFAAQQATNEGQMMAESEGERERAGKSEEEAKSEWVRDMLTQICRHTA